MIDHRSGNCNLSNNCKALRCVPIARPTRFFQNDKEKIWIFSWVSNPGANVLFFCEYKRIQLIYWTYNFVSKELLSSSVIRGLLYNFFLCPSKQPIHFFRSLLGRRKNGRGGGGGEREIEGERPRPLPISLPPNSLHLSTPAMQAFFSIFFRERGGQGRIQDFFLGGGALVSCFTSTPINHMVFFFAEYQLY